MEVGSWDIGTEAPRAQKMGGAPMGRKMGYGIWDMGECAESGREVEGMTNQVGERRSCLFLTFLKKAS
jgi:hypothetical protein